MKILEYVNKRLLKPTGGPEGYVYNLMYGCKSEEIIFDTYDEPLDEMNKRRNISSKLPKFITSFVRVIFENKKIKKIESGNKRIKDIDAYDVIHFHSAFDLVSCSSSFKNFKGKIVLTNHSPIPPFMEIYQDYYTGIMQKLGGKRRMERYKAISEKAFKMADYIVFPCEEAEEAYFQLWEGYKELHCECESKLVYLPTGCIPKMPKISKHNLREKLGLQDSFVVNYIGRHNISKGYDSLKRIGEKCLNSNNDMKFVICGKEGPLYHLDHRNWIEIGWTDNADSYVNMSDVFVLPNKSTYFDLVLLEVLSIGKIVIASNTGGNKYFKQFEGMGLFLYSSEDEAISLIERVKNMSVEQRIGYEENNKKIYEMYFHSNCFSKRYVNFYKDVIANAVKKNYF